MEINILTAMLQNLKVEFIIPVVLISSLILHTLTGFRQKSTHKRASLAFYFILNKNLSFIGSNNLTNKNKLSLYNIFILSLYFFTSNKN